MAIGDKAALRVEGIAAGGEGIARLEGKSVFVRGTAPGEKIRCRITEEHRSWARAELLEIIEASQERVEPACPFYGQCGGCGLQHLNYEAQLAVKAAILRDCFSRIGGFSPPEPAIIPSMPWEYRNRVQIHQIQPQGRKCELGYMTHNSTAFVPISDCPVSDPCIRTVLRESDRGEMPLSPMPTKERFTVYARNGLFLYEGGTERGKTKILDREISLDASVFFQSNGTLLEALAEKLRGIAAGADHSRAMADLYCGVGTFACFLGGFFPKIDLLEENKKAIALAKENIDAALPYSRVDFFALCDTDWAKLRGRDGGYGFIVADPPRQGLAPALASWLAEAGPPLLAYVSCDPASLARDSKVLRKGGYELAELSLFDFYPQTAHIESLAVFVR
jgi:23S rRNA (uracil1939-C5)-methyltransferase